MRQPTPEPHETLDRLVGGWHIFQLARGHRYSTDDQATAWRAARAVPDARSVLDLGSGVGSVGLMTLAQLSADTELVGVEAQQVSYDLACKTVAYNGLQDRVRYVHGDIRDPSVLPEHARFELITGSPPYIPEGHGVISPVPQRAGARMELRGSVYDYCEAARRWLAPGGRFCFVMAAADPRTEDAPVAHGFDVVERWDFVFAKRRDPLIAVLTCARVEDGPHPARATGVLRVRGDDGEWTEEYRAFRAAFGA